MTKERFISGLIIGILLIFLFILLHLYFEGHLSQKEKAYQKPELPTISVYEQPILLKQPFVGTVTSIQSVAILPYINGFVAKIDVKGGQSVQVGDTLFIIRQDEYKALKESAAAQVLSANAAYTNAKTYLARIEKTPSAAISQTELDNAKANFLSAQGNLKAAEAQLAQAQVNYDYTVVKAPISGVVGNIPVTIGDYVSPTGKILANIVQKTPTRVVFSVTNKEYLDFLVGDTEQLFAGFDVRLRLPSGALYPQIGKVVYWDNQVAPDTSSIAVYADFDNPDGLLIPNGYVDVFVEKNISKGILLDKNLVHFEPNGAFVYLKKGDEVKKQPVSLGQAIGQQFYISKGVNNGDLVLVGTIPDFLLKPKKSSK